MILNVNINSFRIWYANFYIEEFLWIIGMENSHRSSVVAK